MYSTPAVSVPLPQPIKVEAKPEPSKLGLPEVTPKMNKVSVKEVSAKDDDSDDDDDANEKPPAPVAAAIAKLKEKPEGVKALRLSNLGVCDVHLQFIIDALHSSQVHLESLDLSFNKLTDAGVHVLCKAFAQGMALELSKLHLGGNKTSPAGMALSQGLKQMRGELSVVWKPQARPRTPRRPDAPTPDAPTPRPLPPQPRP